MSWFLVTFEGVFYKEHGYTKDKIILIALIYHKYMSIQKSDSITKKLHCEYTKNDTIISNWILGRKYDLRMSGIFPVRKKSTVK